MMIIEPKIRGFICTTAHPTGCIENMKQQIEWMKNQPKIMHGAKKVLIIGASMGYGLASRITCAYGMGAATLGVIFDKPATEKRTASAGYYYTTAFEEFANHDHLYAKHINGDAFSDEIKQQTIELIKKDLGKVDLVVYSLASPRRTTSNGHTYHSVLKTIGEPYTNKTIDLKAREITNITIPSATAQEIEDTIKVMGGEDWFDWLKQLKQADVLAEEIKTLAYSYIGPALTHPMYLEGTIGKAKEDLAHTVNKMHEELNIQAYISVNKAVVTQSSAAIPVVPLYIAVLYKVMKQSQNHENCLEQMYRLFYQKIGENSVEVDQQGWIRMDDFEMSPAVQDEISKIWAKISNENLERLADIDGYWKDFYQMFGFDIEGVSYDKPVCPIFPNKLASLKDEVFYDR